jgi:nucleoside phosphorylase
MKSTKMEPAAIKPGTLVCFALKEEAAPFRKLAAAKPGVAILVVGIGLGNAGKITREYLTGNGHPLSRPTTRPAAVFTCGFAGGLDPELKIGDVIFETADEALRTRLSAAGARPGIFYCASRIATTAAEKKKLRDLTGADAVEMESAAIQAICRELEIPCATVRVISDRAMEDLPLDFNALSKPDKNLDPKKLAWAIARSPWKIGALMALQRKTSRAAKQLARVLDQVV